MVVTISSYHVSRASTVEISGCTLKSQINFNSADSSFSTFVFSKRTKASSNLLEEFWETLLNAANLLEVVFAFYISLSPLKSLLKKSSVKSSPCKTNILGGTINFLKIWLWFLCTCFGIFEQLAVGMFFFLLFPYGSSLITLCSSCSNRYCTSE